MNQINQHQPVHIIKRKIIKLCEAMKFEYQFLDHAANRLEIKEAADNTPIQGDIGLTFAAIFTNFWANSSSISKFSF